MFLAQNTQPLRQAGDEREAYEGPGRGFQAVRGARLLLPEVLEAVCEKSICIAIDFGMRPELIDEPLTELHVSDAINT